MSDAHDHKDNAKWEMGFAIASGVTYITGAILEYALNQPDIATIFFLATYFFGGFFTITGAIRSIRHGKFEVDFLMLVAAIGAAFIGKFAEGAVLLFLFSLGHALEEYAMGRAKRSIEALAELAPPMATVITPGGDTIERATEELVPGDLILVKPNSRIPADGVVRKGSSAVDQAAITGESVPVDKQAADPSLTVLDSSNKVFAGTVNGSGSLEVEVSSAASDSTLSRVVQMVRDADSTKSTTQRFIDRFQKYYVPAVIVLVIAVFLVFWLIIGQSPSDSFYKAMVVLVAASPCALAIATPAAVLAGVARAAKAGLLVKGGAPLENLGRVDAIAFDKTGTLTWGQPQLTDIVPAQDVDYYELARTTLAVESESDHPLAGAITQDLLTKVAPEQRAQAENVSAVTGRGVQATVAGEEVKIGNVRFFTEDGGTLPDDIDQTVSKLQESGRTTMIVQSGKRFLGVLGVMDVSRQEAQHVVSSLRDSGVNQLVMISGDNQQVAQAIGSEIGVDTAYGELLPEDKVKAISGMSEQGKLTAMVGDGVNDAPAMATATVGIAMGAAGSAVALETADIALMSDDIGRVPFLIRLSRASSKLIRQNLIISLVIVAFLIPASLAGLAIGPVVFIHEGSTLLVVFNALRLLRFEQGKEHDGIEHESRPQATSAA